MIKLNFNSTKDRMSTYRSMGLVADDARAINRELNRMFKTDLDFYCPEKGENNYGIINDSEIWVGDYSKKHHTIDLNVKEKKSITLEVEDRRMNLFFKLLILSLCEQFGWVSFTTDEDWDEALKMYEDFFGIASKNAYASLGRKEPV